MSSDYGLARLDNVTADQLFFTYYALGLCWLPHISESETMVSPEERVNVPLMNFPEFASAFNCTPGTPMNPIDKCSFWD
ncbi:neprilysin-1-like [Haemaphysalis longicornis]